MSEGKHRQIIDTLLDLGMGDHWRIQTSIDESATLSTQATRRGLDSMYEANLIAGALQMDGIDAELIENGIGRWDVWAR
jgi:hypothetical protein